MRVQHAGASHHRAPGAHDGMLHRLTAIEAPGRVGKAPVPGSQGVVLLVDDEKMIRFIHRFNLAQCTHCVVIEAEDGAEALSNLKAQSIALLLTDISSDAANRTHALYTHLLTLCFSLHGLACAVPVMDGFECTRRYREWEALNRPTNERRTFIVGISASADDDDCKASAEAAGMDLLLLKPITVQGMRQLVELHLPA